MLRSDRAGVDDGLDAQLDALLALPGRDPEHAGDEHGGPRGSEAGERRVRHPGRFDDELQAGVAGAVGDGEEGHGAAALDAAGPDPAAHNHTLAGEGVCGVSASSAP